MSRNSKYPETKEAARQWVEDGKPCTFQMGLSFRGATQSRISQEKARELLKSHHFGMDFYTMFWSRHDGEDVLCFNELYENDLY